MKRNTKLITSLLVIYFACGGQADKATFIKVQKGSFFSSITETGELKAVNSTAILSPMLRGFWEESKIISLEKEGIQVKKGDVVAELDNSKVIQRMEQKKQELAIAQSDLKKLKVKHENELKDLTLQLLENEADLRSAKLRSPKDEFESPTTKEISGISL